MKKSFLFYTLICILCTANLAAQEKFSKFHFSGYKVHLIQSENFAIVTKQNIKSTKEVTNDNVLELSIYDQTGRVPKDDVYVFTDKVEYIYLHNSILVCDETFKTDSLTIITAAAQGDLNFDAKYFSINAGGGSQINISGKTDFFDCAVGGGSGVFSKKFLSKEADIDVMGYSSLVINAQKVRKIKEENASVTNVY